MLASQPMTGPASPDLVSTWLMINFGPLLMMTSLTVTGVHKATPTRKFISVVIGLTIGNVICFLGVWASLFSAVYLSRVFPGYNIQNYAAFATLVYALVGAICLVTTSRATLAICINPSGELNSSAKRTLEKMFTLGWMTGLLSGFLLGWVTENEWFTSCGALTGSLIGMISIVWIRSASHSEGADTAPGD